jgi:hypothetical protein
VGPGTFGKKITNRLTEYFRGENIRKKNRAQHIGGELGTQIEASRAYSSSAHLTQQPIRLAGG